MIETNIEWPEGLPFALRENHSLQAVRPFVRTQLESGRARQRRKFTSVPTMTSAEFIFTSGQAAAFEAWFRDVLKDGTEWFGIVRKTPLGRVRVVCRFTDMYDGPNLFAVSLWRYTCPLELWERPLLPVGYGEFPGFFTQADILDRAVNQEWPEA